MAHLRGKARSWRDRAVDYRGRSVLGRVKAGRPSEVRMGGALAPPRTHTHPHTHTTHTQESPHHETPRSPGPIC